MSIEHQIMAAAFHDELEKLAGFRSAAGRAYGAATGGGSLSGTGNRMFRTARMQIPRETRRKVKSAIGGGFEEGVATARGAMRDSRLAKHVADFKAARKARKAAKARRKSTGTTDIGVDF